MTGKTAWERSLSVRRPGVEVGKAVRFLLDALMHLTEMVGALLLGAMTIVITWQVISRYHPEINSPWTEEVAIMMLVWFGLTGAAIGIRRGTHIGVEFVVALFPPRVQRFLAALVNLVIMVFSTFLFFEGIALARGCWHDRMTVTLVPRGIFVYLAVPVASFLMFIYSCESLIKVLMGEGSEGR
ncbi:MAG: TRAP transporter small permease [Bacillota bacterium]